MRAIYSRSAGRGLDNERASLDARPPAASRTGATGGQGTDDEIRAAMRSTLS
jgi:hypothetical protein